MFYVDFSRLEGEYSDTNYVLVWEEDEKGRPFNAELITWLDCDDDIDEDKWEGKNIEFMLFDKTQDAIEWIARNMRYWEGA